MTEVAGADRAGGPGAAAVRPGAQAPARGPRAADADTRAAV